ncbi:MAG TPA: MFS transporter [Acidimicrobiales bacterium]|nr:MFS transporter [Acidimicrobiales bacterium]
MPDATALGRTRARVVERLQARGRYPRWVLLTALAGMFATSFPITILTVSLGDIALDLGTSETVLAWVISAPLLASAVALPILGKMGDLYGHRRVFLVGFTTATVVAALTALSWDAGSLIGFRTVAQVVGAATMPTSMALIMSVFAPEERVKAMGWWSLVAAGAPSIGLVVGGPLVEALGWRLIFVLQAGFALLAVAVAVVILGETTRKARVRFDLAGATALALGTAGLMYLLSQGVERGFDHPSVVAAAIVGPAGLVLFVRVERRTTDPLLPLDFFRRRNFSAPLVASFFAGAAYMGGFILAPLLLRFVFGMSLSAVALLMVLRPLSFSLSSPVGGHVATRVGERVTAVTGMASLTASMGLFVIGSSTQAIGFIAAGLVMQGVGNGVSRPSLTASLANSVSESDLGIATASERMLFQVGAAFGITALTVVYAGDNIGPAFVRAYLVGVGLAGLALVAATFVRSTSRGSHRQTDVAQGEERVPEAVRSPR